MKFTMQTHELLRLVNKTQSIADQRGSMQILGCLLITADGDEVRFGANDFYLDIRTSAKAAVSKPGGIAINAKTLHQITRALPDGEVLFEVDQQKRTASLSIGSGRGKVNFKLAGLDPVDFPPKLAIDANSPAWDFPVSALLELIGLTNFSMSTDDTRPHLAGTLLEYDLKSKTLTAVTTDGHRLSVAHTPLTTTQGTMDMSVLIPHRGIVETKKFLEEIKSTTKKAETPPEVRVQSDRTARSMRLSYEGTELTVKLADEQFPPYKQVVPSDERCLRAFSVSGSAILETFRRMALVARGNSGNGCALHVDHESGLLRVTANNGEGQEGSEDLSVDVTRTPDVPKLSIGFSVKYLMEPIGAMVAQGVTDVTFAMNEPLDPIKVYPTNDPEMLVGVVMPMRL